jgi:hypothetical protein
MASRDPSKPPDMSRRSILKAAAALAKPVETRLAAQAKNGSRGAAQAP